MIILPTRLRQVSQLKEDVDLHGRHLAEPLSCHDKLLCRKRQIFHHVFTNKIFKYMQKYLKLDTQPLPISVRVICNSQEPRWCPLGQEIYCVTFVVHFWQTLKGSTVITNLNPQLACFNVNNQGGRAARLPPLCLQPLNGLYLYSAFLVSHSCFIHTHTHKQAVFSNIQTPMDAFGTSLGSVTCRRTLQHADQGSWGLDHQLSDQQTI